MKKYYRIQFWKDNILIAESSQKEIATLREDQSIMIDVVGNQQNYLVSNDSGDLALIPYELLSNCLIRFFTYE